MALTPSVAVLRAAQCYPLFCPLTRFTNRWGAADCYGAMNPSLWVDAATGAYTLLIRLVNYRKFHDGAFTLGEPVSNSVYMLQRGPDVADVLAGTPERVEVRYGDRPVYPTYWRGPEDLRFVTATEVLACVPELTPGGHPAVYRAHLDAARPVLSAFEPLAPHAGPEKNWMPYKDGGWIYAVCPWVAVAADAVQRRTMPFDTRALAAYHGSTNGVLVDGWWWFLIHDQKVHRWLRLRADEGAADVSAPFVFFRHTYIEFCCSLALYRGEFWVALGCNDAQALLVRTSPAAVRAQLAFTPLASQTD